MKRGIAVLTCVCALTGAVYFGVSKWGIRHDTLDLFDEARQRPIAVDLAVRRDYEMKADDGYWKLPVAIISNGNTVKNTEYSFLANVFAARGYLVASIQQDLPTDPPLMTKVGMPYVGRLEVYEKGEANILFVLEKLKKLQPDADYDHLTLVGHSNGGDTAMYFAKQHPDLVSKVVTLDNLRVPFVLSNNLKILSFRSGPELPDRSRRAADPTTGQDGRHRYRPYAIPAHLDERPRPRFRQGEDSGHARRVPGQRQRQRSGTGQY